MEQDTIAGIATALSESGISIIRISGPDAINIVNDLFESVRKDFQLKDALTHTIHYGKIICNHKILDEVLVSVMKEPNTYTKENIVEINCHGGVLITRKILDLLLHNGIRMSEPGEFTKRAFLNGRIDLTKAEAVMDLIQSKNDFALKNSMNQLSGYLFDTIKDLRNQIIYEIAFIESALDDPENYDLNGYPEKLQKVLAGIINRLHDMIAHTDDGKMLKEGINTCIVGKPNAGKSSFLNQLIGQDKAIVTDIAGTTRDVIEEKIQLGGFSLNLVDTAGIRETNDQIEKIGVEKARKYASEADLIFYIVDASSHLDRSDDEIIDMIKDKPCIILLNKADLKIVTDTSMILEKTKFKHYKIVSYSVKDDFTSLSGEKISKEKGIIYIKSVIEDLLFSGGISFDDEVVITNLRHKNNLIQARESLLLVMNSIQNHLSEDFYSIDLMTAYQELGFIIGEEVEDDLVNEIFEKFCMGK